MTAAVQDTFDEVLGAVFTDQSTPIKRDSREAVRRAVMRAARKHGGRVTAATIRPFLPRWVVSAQIGSTIRALELAGYLVHTGAYAPNGDAGSRNASKRSPVYRLTDDIPKQAVQP